MSLKTQNISTFLCCDISTHSNKILNTLENLNIRKINIKFNKREI